MQTSPGQFATSILNIFLHHSDPPQGPRRRHEKLCSQGDASNQSLSRLWAVGLVVCTNCVQRFEAWITYKPTRAVDGADDGSARVGPLRSSPERVN